MICTRCQCEIAPPSIGKLAETSTGWVTFDGRPIPVTGQARQLLVELVRYEGAPVSKAQFEAVTGSRGDSKLIAVIACRLRAALTAVGAPAGLIENVHGVGYRINAAAAG